MPALLNDCRPVHVLLLARRDAFEVRHVPFTAKQPALMVKPFAPVEVAVPLWLKVRTLRPPWNVEVAGDPKVAAPLTPLKEREATVEVDSAEDVAMYRVLEMERRVHAFDEPVVSVRASWGPVEDAMVSAQKGVVVPIPVRPELLIMNCGVASVELAT